MDGVLVIDKPQGPTSFDVVRRVRSLLRTKKAGHTGTLDPMATGVLPICLGEATKIAGFLTEGDKTYDAAIRLGVETDTLDAMGKVTAQGSVPPLNAELLEHALSQFRGGFLQTPPMYSAIKQGGKRLYELARQGEEVERTPRQVTVHELRLRDFSADELSFTVRSSKGFYVRTLAQDLGRVLGCGAHLKSLRRTQGGPFALAQALPLEKLIAWLEMGPEGLALVQERLVSLSAALVDLPRCEVAGKERERVLHGVPIEVSLPPGTSRVRVEGPPGVLLALAEVEGGKLRYLRVFNDPSSPPAQAAP